MTKTSSTCARLGAGLLVGLLAASSAGAVVINFDTTPDGNPIAHSTDIALTYASLGVSFALDGSGCGTSVYANADKPAGFGSAPNVVSTCGGGSASDINGQAHGRIRVDLNAPATRVCIDVLPDGEQYNAELSVYDADDKLVAKKASAPGVAGTLCVDGAGIRHARFPGTGNTSTEYARFDNLDVTFAQVTPNYGGLWWRAPVGSEAGWGVNFAHQGDIIFATWFTYDADGKPWWLAVRPHKTAAGVYPGELFTTSRARPFNAVPFNPRASVPRRPSARRRSRSPTTTTRRSPTR